MRLLHGWVRRYPMGGKAVAWPGCRRWALDEAVSRLGSSSCKSPRARILVLRTSGAHWPARWPMCPRGAKNKRGGLVLTSPSVLLKVNYLVMRYLRFESVRGDLQKGNASAARCQLPLFPVPITGVSSTKSGFLCAFGCRDPRFLAFHSYWRNIFGSWSNLTPHLWWLMY